MVMGCSTGRQDSIGVFVRLDKPICKRENNHRKPEKGKYVGD